MPWLFMRSFFYAETCQITVTVDCTFLSACNDLRIKVHVARVHTYVCELQYEDRGI